ncbi:MAG: hypothetical protein KBF60_06950 [Ignavibacteriaceae bacterium]|nr:hypothetical protein [Ignavibacteriaceae bacterium]
MKKYLILTLLLLFIPRISPQSFEIHKYGIREGLSIELTKSIVQDTFGFIWIATDEGVSRFDGYNFTSFNKIPEISFAKQIIKLRDGRLILISDLAVFEIKPALDTAYIKMLIRGDREQKPGYIWFPKSVFEAKDGALYFSEGNAVVRYKNGRLKRFLLADSEISFDFFRAHHFTELESSELLLITYSGGFYRFDNKADNFKKILKPANLNNLAAVEYLGNGRFLLGTNKGIHDITLKRKKNKEQNYEISSSKLFFENQSISDLIVFKERLVFSTWEKGLFSIDTTGGSLNTNNYEEIGDVKIYSLFEGSDGSVWCSTERGILLLSESLFEQVDPAKIKQYIQDIITLKDNKIVVSDGSNVYNLKKQSNGYVATQILSVPNFVVISLLRFKNGILAAQTNGKLIYIDDSGEKSEINLAHKGIFIKYISYGVDDDIWMLVEGSKEIINLKPDLSYKRYDVSDLPIENFTTIFSNQKGEIFAAGTAVDINLIKFNSSRDKFESLNLDLKIKYKSKVTINDIDFDKHGNPVLATSMGVFLIEDNSVSPLTQFLMGMEARSLAVDDVNSVFWVGSSDGVYKFDGQSVYHFDEISGLPSKTIGTRTLTIDNEGQIWVGTASGLALMGGMSQKMATSTPKIIFRSDRNPVSFTNYSDEIEFVENRDWVLMAYNSNFPSRSTLFQYRLDDDTTWRAMQDQNQLHLDDLDAGTYKIEIRARQQGNHTWSESTVLEFTISPLWYKRWWAIILWAISLFLLIYFIIRFNTRRLEAENLALEHLVDERTVEITVQNKELASAKIEVEQKNAKLQSLLNELRALNATKDKMFSIISHDLKNPFTSIIGFASILEDEFESLTNEEKIEFVNKIYNTSTRTYELLENLLNWSRSQTGRIVIQKSNLKLKEMIDKNFELISDSAITKSITLINHLDEGTEVFADYDTINTVMRNLLTNAIKFSMPGKSVEVSAETGHEFVKINVVDHGIGMNQDTISKLFRTDVFHSTNGTNSEKGTGLGLILCKEFVEKNGGKIEVQSEPLMGSTFNVFLPIHSEK